MKFLVLIAGCLLVLGTSARAADESPGRLFFTPQQRSALDAGRRIAAKPKAETRPVQRRTRAVRLDGIVTRSDGERTVWVNGQPHHSGHASGGVRVSDVEPTAARIQVGESSQTVKLKVGETRGRASAAGRVPTDAAHAPRRTPDSVAGGSAASATQEQSAAATRPDTDAAATADHDEKD
jgi:hypothetical protein